MLEKYKILKNSIIKSEDGNILYYYDLSEKEKKHIIDEYSIDSHTLISALDPDEVARLEEENKMVTLIWKIPNLLKLVDTSSFKILSIGFFLIKDKLIIISSDKVNYFGEKVNVHIRSLMDVIFVIQDNSVKHFIGHLKTIKLISRDIQNKINKSMENEYLLQMFNLSEVLVFYLDAIDSNKIVLNKFFGFLRSKKQSANFNYLKDIIVETEQASKQAEIYTQIFAGLMDARGTIVNNNMNVLIKNLTIINIIFLPLNLIASIFGMSEFGIITKGINWKVSYGLFALFSVVIGWFTLLIINKIGRNGKAKKTKYD